LHTYKTIGNHSLVYSESFIILYLFIACLDDAWIDFRNIWPDFEQDYPLEIISNPSFQRYTDWGTVGRQSGCSSGPGFCNSSKSLCDITASCIEEWRSYRCECLNNTVKDDKGKCVPSQCYPNPCVNGECHVLNGASNFTCICYGIWTGPLCNQVSSVNIAGLSWWWILLVVLLLLAILLATIFLIICCRKRREKKKSNLIDFNNELSDQKLGIDTQMNDPWSTGEKDFHGPIDYSVLKGNINSNPYQLTTNGSYQSNGYLPTSRKSDTNGSIDIQTFPSVTARAYGQKTTDIPPWESFDRQPNPAIRLDQVLEYGYEGYDGRPPPEFCPTEPVVSTSYDDYIGDDGDLNIENVQQSIKQPIANGKLNTLNK
uniref:EGF-like domain-containing protein n=1 Tax=Schistosoma curassoni TaxID=6186 RepID=A0A183JWB0_9TREM